MIAYLPCYFAIGCYFAAVASRSEGSIFIATLAGLLWPLFVVMMLAYMLIRR